MRPVNSMIEFKQIIGRGTRLFDGKDYFTIYDFVKAYEHFSDPEWDGPPIADEPCDQCGQYPCECEKPEPQPCGICGKRPCECPEEPCEVCGQIRCVCKKKKRVKVKLADGKERTIDHMMCTTFWHPDGKPMSAQEFITAMFGELPVFFTSEDELRELWSTPDTRAKLLAGLAEKGFGHAQLSEMQEIINAEKSDLFDVLAYVAYTRAPVTREERATRARPAITTHFNYKQQAFLDFVLAQYVKVGVDELASEKLSPLLKLKYHNAIADAVADLGPPAEIGKLFTGFQQYLYLHQVG
jgi:type I restriction enzyme R subunit